ncbi:MAG: universal stress protein [Betaproteobacteria bacterium]
MSYKTLLVHLDGQARNEHTLRLAGDLAGRFDAHLAAVYALEQPLFAAAMDPGAAAALTFQVELDQQMQAKARQMVTATEQQSGRTIEWRTVSGNTLNNVILHARHADLLFMTQDDTSLKLRIDPSFAASVVIGAGRPVLMVPYAGEFKTCGSSVLIAWSGTRESARAVADALPLLKKAREINVVSFNPKGDSAWGELPGADIGLWLTRHGVRVNVRQQKSAEVDVGNQILSLASDLSSDLIVMGAYGHSRTFEFVLGGVTRTLLESMTVPVLMSH